MAGREHLDNLTFVVNCNLQRLDGPVRGNGKVIQEFEALFRGAGWNVIKVIWGRTWDELLAQDVDGVLLDKMNTTVDGEFQKYATESGAYIREHFFGPDPRLTALVDHLTDEELQTLPRGGHDYRKLYAAYRAATEHRGAPTAILAKTVKGWTLGPEIEARNATHQIKKMTKDQLRALRDRLFLHDEIPERDLDADLPPYYRPPPGSPAAEYLAERGGSSGLAAAALGPPPATRPPASLHALADLSAGSERQAVSTTMALARLLSDPSSGPLDSARGSCPSSPTRPAPSAFGDLADQRGPAMRPGPALHAGGRRPRPALCRERIGAGPPGGITEASVRLVHRRRHLVRHLGEPAIPFYLFYSMFVPTVATCSGPSATAEARASPRVAGRAHHAQRRRPGQHQAGYSLLLASTVPSVAAYDPAFSYEPLATS